jgi:hypothetical protein
MSRYHRWVLFTFTVFILALGSFVFMGYAIDAENPETGEGTTRTFFVGITTMMSGLTMYGLLLSPLAAERKFLFHWLRCSRHIWSWAKEI